MNPFRILIKKESSYRRTAPALLLLVLSVLFAAGPAESRVLPVPGHLIAISPDGRFLAATGYRSRDIQVIELATGAQVKKLSSRKSLVRSLAFSPDGKYLACGVQGKSNTDEGWLQVWAVEKWKLVNERREQNAVETVAFSPDGRSLAFQLYPTAIVLLNAGSWDVKGSLLNYVMSGLAFSPDGRWLATGGYDKAVKVFKTADWSVRVLKGSVDNVYAVAFSPDSKFLASSGDKVRIWNTDSWGESGAIKEYTNILAYSPDGGQLATDKGLWGVFTGRSIQRWDVGVVSVAFTPNGDVALGRGGVEIVSLTAPATQAGAKPSDGTVDSWIEKASKVVGQIDDQLLFANNALALWKPSDGPKKKARALYLRGSAYFYKDKLQETLRDYDEAIKLDPSNDSILTSRGNVHSYLENWDKALKDFDEAIRLNPKGHEAYYARSRVRVTGKERIADLDLSIAMKPTAEAYSDRGDAHQRAGHSEKSLDDLNKAVQLDPKSARAYLSRANVLLVHGRPEETLKDLSEAIRLDPKYREAYSRRGFVLFMSKKYDEALGDLNRAVELDNSDGDALFYRGIIYLATGGHSADAAYDFRKAARTNSTNSKTALKYEGLAWLENSRVFPDSTAAGEAAEAFDAYLKLEPGDAEVRAMRDSASAANRDRIRADVEKITSSSGSSGIFATMGRALIDSAASMNAQSSASWESYKKGQSESEANRKQTDKIYLNGRRALEKAWDMPRGTLAPASAYSEQGIQ